MSDEKVIIDKEDLITLCEIGIESRLLGDFRYGYIDKWNEIIKKYKVEGFGELE